MSYIISKTSPFISTKLTEKGREKLALGQLNFKSWALGDSEINYGYEEIKDDNRVDASLNGNSKILSPKDNQPNLKYFITKNINATPYTPLGATDMNVSNLLVNNRAEVRGFFDDSNNPKMGTPFVVSTGTVISDKFNGVRDIHIPNSQLQVGNLILFKITNEKLGSVTPGANDKPIQHVWYKIQGKEGYTYTMDRNLPLLSNSTTPVEYIEYPSGEIYENGMANDGTVPYWDRDTLSFDSTTNVQMDSVPVLNMNNIWSENIIGLHSETAEEFFKYGSNDMMGMRSPYLSYLDKISPNEIHMEDVTETENKAISVIHYTNNSISNHYGEFFFIDDSGKTLKLQTPDIMYHRRKFSGGTGSGDQLGMTFISNGEKKKIKNSEIEYVDLIEDPTLVEGTPKVIGKVLSQHQVIIIDDDEIVAALSYKSGRNWTLPELDLTFTNPIGGSNLGMLAKGETVYVTYVLEDATGKVAYNLPCQNYAKITNDSEVTKDVSFIINDVDKLPYMRKTELDGYDGLGFSATNFKVLYQVVGEGERPASDKWREHDFTNINLTYATGDTIDPKRLENQISDQNGFKLTKGMRDSDSDDIYEINSKLGLPTNGDPNRLQFGDERFFYGNLETYIGASIYRTVFNLTISGSEYTHTTNPTRSQDYRTNPPEVRVSEVGIYDSDNTLVFIGKLSEPIKLVNGNSITLELSMDF